VSVPTNSNRPGGPILSNDLPGEGEISSAWLELKPRTDNLTIVGSGRLRPCIMIEKFWVVVAWKDK